MKVNVMLQIMINGFKSIPDNPLALVAMVIAGATIVFLLLFKVISEKYDF